MSDNKFQIKPICEPTPTEPEPVDPEIQKIKESLPKSFEEAQAKVESSLEVKPPELIKESPADEYRRLCKESKNLPPRVGKNYAPSGVKERFLEVKVKRKKTEFDSFIIEEGLTNVE